jgi:YVTN family beta-propeller protein
VRVHRLRSPRNLASGVALACAFACALGAAAFAALARTELPTEWKLSPPQAIVVATKTLPQSAVFTADGNHLVVIEGGAGTPGIRILRPQTLATERDIAVKGAYGVPLADEASTGFWASTGAQNSIAHYDAATGVSDRNITLPQGFWASSIVRANDHKTLAVSGDLADAVVFVDPLDGDVSDLVKVGHHPAGLAFSRDGKTLYVANWSGTSITTIDVASRKATGDIAVGRHPETLLLSKDGSRLYVTETDDDAIGAIDTASGKRIADLNVAPYAGFVFGASPTAMIFSRDGARLFVACSAANAVTVIDVSGAAPRTLGELPVGWYPTALALEADGTTLDVVNGKGESSRPNPTFDPFHRAANPEGSGYVASSMIGSVRRVPIPSDGDLEAGTSDVLRNGGPALASALDSTVMRLPSGSPKYRSRSRAPGGFLERGIIHHVIYVVKENRTYDQVLGDLPNANGDASLTLFGSNVTPNQHALAKRFGILDNTFADAEVSADGHNWSMAAFANDYLEKMWPQNYGGRRVQYDFEDGADASVPHSGYLWNAAIRAHVTLRNYGEFTTEGERGGPVTSQMAGLGAVTDPRYVGFDTNVRDEVREAEWAREFDAYVSTRSLPQLEIVRLPNDHTAGTRVGKRTPTAYVAENDLAVGKLVARVSHSIYWRDTAIFIVEDDAQNGPDHVDAQRMTAYLISPYSRGGVIHEHYSTAGVVRTIGLLLHMPPLSAYDFAAAPMSGAFTETAAPNFAPYDALPPGVDLEALNAVGAYRAKDSARFDLSHEDAVPDGTLNDIVWHAVRGTAATPPPYGEFDAR